MSEATGPARRSAQSRAPMMVNAVCRSSLASLKRGTRRQEHARITSETRYRTLLLVNCRGFMIVLMLRVDIKIGNAPADNLIHQKIGVSHLARPVALVLDSQLPDERLHGQ